MTQTGQKTAFVFAGGGSLGAIQVGMLRVLLSAGLHPDFVIGSSVGAIHAGYFAGAPNNEGVARLAQIWSGLRRGDVFPFTFASVVGLLRHPDYSLRYLIENNLPYLRVEDATIPVHVTATNLDVLAVLLSTGPAIDAILTSAAIPGIFPPVRNRRPDADGRRNRYQHSHSGSGGPRSITARRASNGICLRLERASERSDRQGLARNHPVNRMATRP